jgi:predicted DNA-binding WGR domain protein
MSAVLGMQNMSQFYAVEIKLLKSQELVRRSDNHKKLGAVLSLILD